MTFRFEWENKGSVWNEFIGQKNKLRYTYNIYKFNALFPVVFTFLLYNGNTQQHYVHNTWTTVMNTRFSDGVQELSHSVTFHKFSFLGGRRARLVRVEACSSTGAVGDPVAPTHGHPCNWTCS